MKRLEKKHPLAIRWFHWINFPALTVMIWSGMLIYWANDVYRIGGLFVGSSFSVAAANIRPSSVMDGYERT